MDALFAAFFDDAAVFPPGNTPLTEAVPAHVSRSVAPFSSLLGPIVLATPHLPALNVHTADMPPGSLPLSLVASWRDLTTAIGAAGQIPAVALVGLEVSVPDGLSATEVVPSVSRYAREGLPVFLEIPRDKRRESFVAALAGTAVAGKLRTGGVHEKMHPSNNELAQVLVQLAKHHVDFKATAGLHHAIRNTDPDTGFEQHGFLNVLLAAALAADGAHLQDVENMLAQRAAPVVVAGIKQVDPGARQVFRSFGTCSLRDPLTELIDLQLLPNVYRAEVS